MLQGSKDVVAGWRKRVRRLIDVLPTLQDAPARAAVGLRAVLRLRDLADLCRWMQDDFVTESEWREIPTEIELAPGVTVAIPKDMIWLPKALP